VLKIVTIGPEANGTVLQLEGQIIGPWVDELQHTCDRLLTVSPITLDLAHVSFVTRGVPLLHCSPFVAEQLRVQE